MREALGYAEDDASVSDIAPEPSSPVLSTPVSATSPTATRGSDAGCSCCPSLSESEHKLTQRRALLASSKQQTQDERWDEESQSSSSASGRIPVAHERVLWLVLMLASTMLCFTLLPLETLSLGGSFASAVAFANNILATWAPQGPLLWRLQWRFQGGPDPRPLWQPDFLGPSAEWPHGSAAGLASAMGAGQITSVAVVGNGPLTDAQRQEINAADRVVRFNAMNNRRIDERVDVWVVRNNRIPPYNFWGFQQLNDTEVELVIQHAKAVLFLGGSRTHNQTEMADAVDQVLFWYPNIREEQVQQINFNSYWDVYNRVLSKNSSSTIETAEAMPSSGLLGILAVLSAVGPGVKVDMYGFNWSLKSYAAHKMNAEEQILRAVKQQHPDIAIHPTACDALYSCEELCDTGNFRLAVDEENCLRQVQRARAGKKVRFIDHHSMHNLGWHPELHQEVEKLKPPESDDQALQEAWLRKAVLVLEEDEDPLGDALLPASHIEAAAPDGDSGELQATAGPSVSPQSGPGSQLLRKLTNRKVKQL